MMERYSSGAAFDRALAALWDHWSRLLDGYQVSSGDEKLDRMVNIWNQYQCMVTFNMSRSASYFESGMGRGMGFRDSCQNLLGVVHMIPRRARERILDIAATQFPDGSAYHQYQPLTKRAIWRLAAALTTTRCGSLPERTPTSARRATGPFWTSPPSARARTAGSPARQPGRSSASRRPFSAYSPRWRALPSIPVSPRNGQAIPSSAATAVQSTASP